VSDLRLRARDEEAEEVGGDPLLARRERAERLEQVVLDDLLGAAELLEPRDRQVAGRRRDRSSPEPLHYELEERRLDALGAGDSGIRVPSALSEREVARRCRVDHRLDECGLERVRRLLRRKPAIPLVDRALDRVVSGRPAQMFDADVVREQARDAPLEAIELRQSVLTDREQEVHSEVGLVHDSRELACEGALTGLVRVVEEVVLELIEDDEQRAHRLGPGAKRLRDRVAGPPRRRLVPAGRLRDGDPNRLHERRQWIVAPGGEDADREGRAIESPRRFLAHVPPKIMDDACPQERRLSDSALPVEERQPECAQVPTHDARLLFPAEEEGGVFLAVGNETDVGRLGWSVWRRLPPRGSVGHAGGPDPKSSPARRAT
jgi:hypothetical protein